MVKKVIAIVLIVLSAGAWFYLDYLNKQELQAAEEMRQAMERARVEAAAKAKAAAEARAKFEADLKAELATCQAAAEKTKADYLTANSKPVPKKPGQFVIPKGVQEEADKKLAEDNAACQQAYDTKLQTGH